MSIPTLLLLLLLRSTSPARALLPGLAIHRPGSWRCVLRDGDVALLLTRGWHCAKAAQGGDLPVKSILGGRLSRTGRMWMPRLAERGDDEEGAEAVMKGEDRRIFWDEEEGGSLRSEV